MVSQADGFAGAAPYSKDVFTKNKAVAKKSAAASGCQKSDFDNLRIKTAEADFYSKASHLLQKWLFNPKNGAEKPIFAVVN